jgi:hypothetical protein
MCEQEKIENTADYEFRLLIYVYHEECNGRGAYVRTIKRETIGEQKTFTKRFEILRTLCEEVATDIKTILGNQKDGENTEIGILFSSGMPDDIVCSRGKPPTRYLDLNPDEQDRFWKFFKQNY